MSTFNWAVFDKDGTLRGKFQDASTAFRFKKLGGCGVVKHIESNRVVITLGHAFTYELEDLMKRYSTNDAAYYNIMYFPKGRDSRAPGSCVHRYESSHLYSELFDLLFNGASRVEINPYDVTETENS